MASSVPGRNDQGGRDVSSRVHKLIQLKFLSTDRNQEATVYMGNLDEKVTDALVWELMLQAGPVTHVHLPRDRVSMTHQGFGFCEFAGPEDAEYACKIMNQIKLFGKPIRVNMASSDRKPVEIGANLFIGSLDSEVDENLLHTAFNNFGTQTQPAKIARDDNFQSKGYGFVYYDSFEAADQAIETMNGQYLMNKAVSVQYAFKKDGKGERHGTQAERLLAAQARKNNAIPASNFAPPPPPSAPFMPPQGFSAPPGLPGMPSMQHQQQHQPGPPPGFGQPQGFVPPPPPGFQ